MIISKLSKTQKQNHLKGTCANCKTELWESQWILDDCYNVWAGQCPECNAYNLLSMDHGLRGYDSKEMHLVLPTIEELESNPDLPRDCPNQGSKGPATFHGTVLGEIANVLLGPQKP